MTIVVGILICIGLYFAIRLFLLKKTIRELTNDFQMARKNLRGEQHVQLHSPDKDLDFLAAECNEYIIEYFKEQYVQQKEIQSIRNEITNLSHDLRTPITSILGYVDLLQEEELTSEQHENLEVVKRRSQDLNALIEQLYDYARLENKEMKIEMYSMDLFHIVREHLLSFYHEFEQKEIALTLDFPKQEEPIWITGNQNCIERVLLNLTSNAIKYSENRVAIAVQNKARQVSITYQTPRGNLTNYDIAHMFDRFYKKDSARRNVKSTGLGLTIAKLYMEQMDGNVTARGTESDLFIEVQFPKMDR